MKFFQTILWGYEFFFEGFMGVRKVFEAVYGGMKILRLFQKGLPTGYPALKKTDPLGQLTTGLYEWLNTRLKLIFAGLSNPEELYLYSMEITSPLDWTE